MAADVRQLNSDESNYTNSSDRSRSSSEYTESKSLAINLSRSNNNDGSVPSYMIVHKQITDVLLTQKSTVEQLIKNSISILNESRVNFDSTVKSQEEKIEQLEKSITEDYVLKEVYTQLQNELKEKYVHKDSYLNLQEKLEEECRCHGETQAKLQLVFEKFEDSLQHISSLENKLSETTASFSLECTTLQKEISDVYAQNKNLKVQLQEKTALCEEQLALIDQKQMEIEELVSKHHRQMLKYNQKLSETEVVKQQEAYLSRVFSNSDVKKQK